MEKVGHGLGKSFKRFREAVEDAKKNLVKKTFNRYQHRTKVGGAVYLIPAVGTGVVGSCCSVLVRITLVQGSSNLTTLSKQLLRCYK
jgi:hypothetical protein